MPKKQDNTKIWIFIVVVAIIIFAIGASKGWFKSELTIVNQDIINRLENPVQPPGTSCSISFSKTNLKVGEQVTGTLRDGVNTQCRIYVKFESSPIAVHKSHDWILDSMVMTGPTGTYSETRIPDKDGTFTFAAICGDCVTNPKQLIVTKPTVPLPVDGDTDGDGFSDNDENDFGTDPNDPNDYPGHRVCGKITNPASQATCDQAISCGTGNECKFGMSGGIGGDRWCSCEEVEELVIGCNDADFTQTNFDDSILTSTHCADALGTHVDSCEGGLLQEWTCPIGGDTCSNSFANCESFLGDGAYCDGGACVPPSDLFAYCDRVCELYLEPQGGGFEGSIPLADIDTGLVCGDEIVAGCSMGVDVWAAPGGECCCWNCN